MSSSRTFWLDLLASLVITVVALPASAQQPQKPNILVIMGDDIGYWNISAYNRGQMGYRTPNIDRIANEGAIFTERVLADRTRLRRVLRQPLSPERRGGT
jgi:Sulfatase